jgi:hypothetical protein
MNLRRQAEPRAGSARHDASLATRLDRANTPRSGTWQARPHAATRPHRRSPRSPTTSWPSCHHQLPNSGRSRRRKGSDQPYTTVQFAGGPAGIVTAAGTGKPISDLRATITK